MRSGSHLGSLYSAIAELAAHAGESARDLAQAAQASESPFAEQHPLGMTAVRFPLADREIRLHIWHPAADTWRDDLGALHDHTWHLHSHVLLGAIDHVVVEVQPVITGGTHSLREWKHDYVSNDLNATGSLYEVVSEQRSVVHEGEEYRLPAGQIHRTSAAAGTITLVSSEPSGVSQARVFGTAENRRRSASRRTIGMCETVALVERLI